MAKIYNAFTVKITDQKYPQEEDYEKWLHNAYLKGFETQCFYYELDKKGKLHIHGVALAPKNFYKKSLLQKGYHQNITEIPSWMDLQQWSNYIQKDFINQEEYQQMLDSYRVRTHQYPFQEALNVNL